jgi:hypothetical protein
MKNDETFYSLEEWKKIYLPNSVKAEFVADLSLHPTELGHFMAKGCLDISHMSLTPSTSQ